MNRPAHDAWDDCPPGEFTRLTSRLRGRRRRRRVARVAAAASAVVVLACVALWVRPGLDHRREYDFAGIRCSRVLELAQERGIDQLDEPLRQQVHSHVDQCPLCQERLKAMGMELTIRPKPTDPGAEVMLIGLRRDGIAMRASRVASVRGARVLRPTRRAAYSPSGGLPGTHG